MSRHKKKPDLEDDMGVNPFTPNLKIYTTKREFKVINKFGNEDIKETEFEATPYTKVFEVEGCRKQIFELPIRSKEMYLYLIHVVKSAQDYIWIDKDEYMAKMGINSINTYKSAIKGLSDNGYVARHDFKKDVYWINPHFFFKGSRLNKYRNNIILK